MNIDELTKSQLLLLTILVNFVMSIATGILTVSLLDQSSPIITQTVNRIVEHTVDTVVPQTQPVTAPTPVKNAPSEEDQLVSAIAANAARQVTIKDTTGSVVLASGVFLPKARVVVTAAFKDVPDQALVEFANGSTSPVSLSRENTNIAIYGFSDDAVLPNAPALSFAYSDTLKQGQAVIALTGDGSAVTGIVSKIGTDTISTTLPDTPLGSAAVNLAGNLVGVTLSTGVFASATSIQALLTSTTSPQT